MLVCGLQKLSLLDYPGKTAATVFTCGCNFRCPFCHNSSLVIDADKSEKIDLGELLSFLKKRQKLLDGICITGGEPLLQEDINLFISEVRSMGFLIKLDTNGSFPQRLKELVNSGLIDYVAMDVKNTMQKYALTTGKQKVDLDKINESIEFLKKGKTEYEFRTTVVKELHTGEDIAQIGKLLSGAKHWYLQQFADSGSLIVPGWHAHSAEKMQALLAEAQKYVPSALLRGV